MFTGIIEETGKVREFRKSGAEGRITVACRRVLEGLKKGDSVAVNGVCLTVVEIGQDFFTADVSEESLMCSNLGGAGGGTALNLERALSPTSRLGGHIVQGHVDGTGTLKAVRESGRGRVYIFSASPEVQEYLVEKGSIAVDGISLTVSALTEDGFSVAAIPHTMRETNMDGMKVGDTVNLEVDIIAKYVRRYMERGLPAPGAAREEASLRDKLAEGGFI